MQHKCITDNIITIFETINIKKRSYEKAKIRRKQSNLGHTSQK